MKEFKTKLSHGLILCIILLFSSLNLTACKDNGNGSETTTEATTTEYAGIVTVPGDETDDTGIDTDTATEAITASEENPADLLAGIVLENAPFPMMQQYTTAEEMEQYAAITLPDNVVFSYYCQMMSVHLAEVFIIIAGDDAISIDDAYSIVETRGEKLRNDMAFYPTQQAAAESTIYGKKGNVAYIICVENAKEAEKALLDSME